MLDTHGRKWVQPWIERIARWFLRWGLSANQVTWLAFGIGLPVGWFIVWDHPVMAVFLLWISGILDAVDGTMARQEQRTTPWGTLLDLTFDRLVELSVIVGLAFRWPDARLVLLLLTASIVFSITVFLTVGALSEKKGIKSFYYQAGLAERTEGFLLFSLMILFPDWLPNTTALFLAVELFTAFQRMSEARRLLK
ncbi:phosphatidylglycerophosphate synthase [Melghirimyces profundicolus]|uniref:Phosphatidylglycerophosphate synthase n=1 Tax=Melghirimyces profundicolus TaxID=1242148 RepID=A0A2T6C8U4_9BACL|nr:CDP-alcohol phosphatidyltransferase family protein [Melghirimyces profundicolus]PTX64719.1 phosphatidylglycerophosphate synthase [Melghirimyces profundicolus]